MNKKIIGNLKAYMTYQDVKNYVDKITDNVILCPSAIYVPYFLNHNIDKSDIIYLIRSELNE